MSGQYDTIEELTKQTRFSLLNRVKSTPMVRPFEVVDIPAEISTQGFLQGGGVSTKDLRTYVIKIK